MTEVPEGTLQYWEQKLESYTEKMNTTERRMWRAWKNFKRWKSMIRRLGQRQKGKEHPNALRQFTARDQLEQFLMDLVSLTENRNSSLYLKKFRHHIKFALMSFGL